MDDEEALQPGSRDQDYENRVEEDEDEDHHKGNISEDDSPPRLADVECK